ncbi:MAG: tripartite tricarboxylate transporter TctB family protein [Synergistaceae bacterium]|jgi:putative tricarboxylic transport membrane protein|nr:tripartite tricarboxylate transporter TctB family protein [Synergistaceae bacterium]
MRRDTVVGLFSVLLGGLYGAATLQIRDATIGNPWSPRVFPLGISVFLILLGVAALVVDRKKASAGHRESASGAKDPGCIKLIVGTVVLCGAYGFAFEPLGYILSTLCFMFCLLTLVNEPKRWVANIVITLIFTFALWGTFVYVFDIMLPSFNLEEVRGWIGGGI